MSLSRGSGLALWRQIAEQLETEIERTQLPANHRLPPETELADRFGVNRHTVRRAVALLQDRGLVRIEQGRGTFVAQGLFDLRLGTRVRFSELVRRQARTGSGDLLSVDTIAADAAIAGALALDEGAPVWRIASRGRVDGVPISLAEHHFSAVRFPNFGDVARAERSITRCLQIQGVGDYTRKSTRVTARPATAEEAQMLEIARTVPLLVTEAVNVDPDGQPLEYGVARFAANRVQVVFAPED